jgi:hypothetical protein
VPAITIDDTDVGNRPASAGTPITTTMRAMDASSPTAAPAS